MQGLKSWLRSKLQLRSIRTLNQLCHSDAPGICILRSFPYSYSLTLLHWVWTLSFLSSQDLSPSIEKGLKSHCLANIMGKSPDYHSLYPSGKNGWEGGRVGWGAGGWNDRMPGNSGRGYETITEPLKCTWTRRGALLNLWAIWSLEPGLPEYAGIQ